MMKKVALVGCGRISKNHIDALVSLSDRVRLVSVCDISIDAAKKTAFENNCKAYYDLSNMLENEDVDILSICTPSGLHPQHIKVGASHYVHCISEKPVGTRMEDAVKAVEECDKYGVNLYVVKQNRFNPTVVQLKKLIDAGAFGKIYLAQSNVFWTRPQDYYDTSGWRGTWEFDGGAIMNQASHYVDLLQYLLGSVSSVSGFSSTLGRDIEAEDTAVVSLKFRSGALGSLNVTMLTYPKNLEGSILIIGEKGTFKISGVALNNIDVSIFDGSNSDYTSLSYKVDSVYGSGHTPFYSSVLDHLDGLKVETVTGRDGLKSLDLIQTIYKSTRDHCYYGLPQWWI
jgi:UDP-N-acetyl-2-amino-2-deoxyglucuronate dehydrogenase